MVYRYYVGRTPRIVIVDLELLKDVMAKMSERCLIVRMIHSFVCDWSSLKFPVCVCRVHSLHSVKHWRFFLVLLHRMV